MPSERESWLEERAFEMRVRLMECAFEKIIIINNNNI